MIDPSLPVDTRFASVITSAPGPGHRKAAGALTAALLAASAFGFANAALPWPNVPAFLPAFWAAVIITETITAVLLLAQLRIARNPSIALLVAGYLFSAAMVVPHMAMFPGVFSDTFLLGAGPQSAVWLWMIWHGGFPLYLAAYALAGTDIGALEPRAVRFLSRAVLGGTLALVTGLAILVSAGHDLLPTIIVAGNYQRAIELGVAPAVWLSNGAAVALLLWRRRARTVLDLWLVVAALASFLDVTLTLAGGNRYSAGWYLARMNSLVSASVILVALLREVNLLYQRVVELVARLARLAAQDGLTEIANRRAFDEALDAELRRAQRNGRPLALLLADVDFFKHFNDRYGHPAGDACLRRIAGAIEARARRPGDIAARFGGEEFALLLVDTDAAGAAQIAATVLQDIRDLAIPHEASDVAHVVTVSIGASSCRPPARTSAAALVAAADAALYAAKRQGRDRFVMASGAAPETAAAEGSLLPATPGPTSSP